MLFISYTRADRDGIGTLLTDLRALGHAVWMDEELSGGEVWWNEIVAKIRQCDAFLFLVSPSSVESEACLLELSYAIALNRIVIPVHIVETDLRAMPSSLESHQIVTYTQGDKTETMALARALAHVEAGRPLPDPLPEEPPLPGSYFGSIRDRIKSRDPMNLDQQLGLLYRLRLRADDEARDDVLSLLTGFRARDDLFASVATQIDELQRLLAPLPPAGEPRAPGFRSRLRRPVSLVDRVTVTLVAISIVAAAVAMFSTLWQVESNTPNSWGDDQVGLQRWHLIVFVVLFVIAALLGFTKVRAVRKLAGPSALLVSLIGLVIWWWGSGIDGGLLHEHHVSSDSADIKLRLGMTGSGLSLALEVLAGVLLTLSAYSRKPI